MCRLFGHNAVYLIVRGRGYLGWIEYIEKVVSSLAMVLFRNTKFLLCFLNMKQAHSDEIYEKGQ